MPEVIAAEELCEVCSQPPGECYNICPNSQRYYSAAQERENDFPATLAEHHAAWHAQNGANRCCPWDCDPYLYDDADA